MQYAQNVWNLDVDFEHPEMTVNRAIDMQEEYYKSIGMPTSLRDLRVRQEDLEKLALACSRDKSRVLIGYRPIAYDDMLAIYQMAY